MKPTAAKPPHSSSATSAQSGEGWEADSLPEGLAPEIDPARFARAGERLAGSTSVARMPRLLASEVIRMDDNPVQALRNRRVFQVIVRTMHAALGRRLLVLLNGHVNSLQPMWRAIQDYNESGKV